MRLRRTHTGFSLIELMIGVTIGLVLLTVLATVFDRTSGGRSDLDRVSRLVENSRFAVDVIGDDVRHAGFYGTFYRRPTLYLPIRRPVHGTLPISLRLAGSRH